MSACTSNQCSVSTSTLLVQRSAVPPRAGDVRSCRSRVQRGFGSHRRGFLIFANWRKRCCICSSCCSFPTTTHHKCAAVAHTATCSAVSADHPSPCLAKASKTDLARGDRRTARERERERGREGEGSRGKARGGGWRSREGCEAGETDAQRGRATRSRTQLAAAGKRLCTLHRCVQWK